MSAMVLFRVTVSALILLVAGALASPYSNAAEFATSKTAKTLTAGGAKITSMSYVKREGMKYGFKIKGGGSSAYKCGKVACYCEGAGDCANLIASNQCSDDFHCAGNSQGPACVCTQK